MSLTKTSTLTATPWLLFSLPVVLNVHSLFKYDIRGTFIFLLPVFYLPMHIILKHVGWLTILYTDYGKIVTAFHHNIFS